MNVAGHDAPAINFKPLFLLAKPPTIEDNIFVFLSDILGSEVERPEVIESTAMGAAYLAGIQIGLWKKEAIK